MYIRCDHLIAENDIGAYAIFSDEKPNNVFEGRVLTGEKDKSGWYWMIMDFCFPLYLDIQNTTIER